MNTQYSLLVFIVYISWINAEPLVQISQGTLNGTIQISRSGKNYSAFLGIPYALPPIGNLRFANPQPAGKWDGVRQANEFGNICVQKNKKKQGEDCLFLNVYTPRLEFNSSSKNNTLLPVMVWIHGGAFIQGSSNDYGAQYILDKDVILVTINYRLGIFGFFSTGDSVAPGNFGMKDQVLALKWVQQNIKSFSGDPNKVTIFGESAGGASVALHALSKASSGLFHQYIIQSGANLVPWAYQEREKYSAYVREISALVFCPFKTSRSVVDCLRKSSVERLVSTSLILGTITRLAQIIWTPTNEADVEGAFLIDSPINLIARNQMKDLPFISGVVSDEGLIVTEILRSNNILYDIVKFSLKHVISFIVDYYIHPANKPELAADIDQFYFNSSTPSNKYEFLEDLTRLISDAFFFYPQVKMLEKVTPKMKSHSYFYDFGYRGSMNKSPKTENEFNYGVKHTKELSYLFSYVPELPTSKNFTYAKTDISISKLMVDLWTSFAINGKPTTNELSKSDLWEPYTTKNGFHLQIGDIYNDMDPSVSLHDSFYTERMKFWRKNSPL